VGPKCPVRGANSQWNTVTSPRYVPRADQRFHQPR
jgi:hypothetical protein